MPVFHKFPEEAAIIGRLLAGYSELEIGLMHCVQDVRMDFDVVLKTMFRTRGETQRIDIADALGRMHFAMDNLETQFAMAIGNMRYCLKIRNQYAHCAWNSDASGKLAFSDLEEIARQNDMVGNFKSLKVFHLNVPLLTQQEQYFEYVDSLLSWLRYEDQVRCALLQSNPYQEPEQLKRPDLHIP